jgi:murein DD-endopeptidase MepM/ murein hydrolase activator NlpD
VTPGTLPSLILCALLILLPCVRSAAGIVSLTSPSAQVCITDPSAVYSVVGGALRPVSGEFALSAPGEQPLQPQLSIPSESAAGEVVRVYVRSDQHLDSATLQLASPGKSVVSRSTGFRVSSESSAEVWALLLGVPDGITGKAYTLTLRITAGARSFLALKGVSMRERTFFTERFPITGEMTTLLTKPDPKKMAESHAFYTVLTTPHADALYETGAFAVPLPGARRSAGFGDRRVYVNPDETSSASVHLGVDIASPEATPVPACGAGRVVFAANRIMTGNTVIIEHLPGVFTVYFHMASISVKEGDLVGPGEHVGTVGMTGFATGPHLHWEAVVSGIAVDPDSLARQPLLDKSPQFVDTQASNSTEGR